MAKSITVEPESRLERHVRAWINKRAKEYDSGARGVIEDLMHGGCASGYVEHLIYYTDTVKFFARYRKDISALLSEAIDSTGMQPGELFGDSWDASDPLAQEDNNRSLLAWFGFEEAARRLAEREGIEY